MARAAVADLAPARTDDLVAPGASAVLVSVGESSSFGRRLLVQELGDLRVVPHLGDLGLGLVPLLDGLELLGGGVQLEDLGLLVAALLLELLELQDGLFRQSVVGS